MHNPYFRDSYYGSWYERKEEKPEPYLTFEPTSMKGEFLCEIDGTELLIDITAHGESNIKKAIEERKHYTSGDLDNEEFNFSCLVKEVIKDIYYNLNKIEIKKGEIKAEKYKDLPNKLKDKIQDKILEYVKDVKNWR